MSTSRTEKIAQLSVVLIAICAVAVSVWQGQISQRQLKLTQEHNRLTVKPYIDITRFTNSTEGTVEVNISNQGFGPAIIKKFELIFDGQSYDNWNALLDAAQLNTGIRFLNNYSNGSILASGKEEVLMRIVTTFDHKAITIKIGYESIYEEPGEIAFTF